MPPSPGPPPSLSPQATAAPWPPDRLLRGCGRSATSGGWRLRWPPPPRLGRWSSPAPSSAARAIGHPSHSPFRYHSQVAFGYHHIAIVQDSAVLPWPIWIVALYRLVPPGFQQPIEHVVWGRDPRV